MRTRKRSGNDARISETLKMLEGSALLAVMAKNFFPAMSAGLFAGRATSKTSISSFFFTYSRNFPSPVAFFQCEKMMVAS